MPNPNDVSPTTSHDLRCPECSAHVIPSAEWCTLCFADLRPPAPVEAEPEPAVEPIAAPEQSAAQPDQPVERSSGKHARAATSYDEPKAATNGEPRDAAATAEFEARADEMLAILAADTSHPLGPLASRLESTSSRALAATVGAVVLLLAVLLVMSLIGRFI